MRYLGVTYFTVASLAIIGQSLENKFKEFGEMFSRSTANVLGQT